MTRNTALHTGICTLHSGLFKALCKQDCPQDLAYLHRTLHAGFCAQRFLHMTLHTGFCVQHFTYRTQDFARRFVCTALCPQVFAHRILYIAHRTDHSAGFCEQRFLHRTLHAVSVHSTLPTGHRTLHAGFCAQHFSHRTLHTGFCTLHSGLFTAICKQAHSILAHRTLHTGFCTLHTGLFTALSKQTHSTLPTGHRTLHAGFCAQQFAHSTLHTGFCTLHTGLFTALCKEDSPQDLAYHMTTQMYRASPTP